MDHTTQFSQFPKFHDGDVQITLTPSKELKLHSQVLRRFSVIFSRLLDQEYAATLSAKARKEGITTRFRLQLDANGTFLRLVSSGRSCPSVFSS